MYGLSHYNTRALTGAVFVSTNALVNFRQLMPPVDASAYLLCLSISYTYSVFGFSRAPVLLYSSGMVGT